MWQKYKEVVSSGVISAFGFVYLIMSFSVRQYGDAVLDSRSLPKVLGALLLVFGLIRLFASIKILMKANSDEPATEPEEAGSRIHVILTLALMLAYALTMKTLGFLISTTVYMFFQSIILFPKRKMNYLITIAVSLIFSVSVYLVFVRVFSLVLPQGILG